MTQDRLKDELNMRRLELDKIDVLEDKIKSELAQLAEKNVQLEQQAGQFANVGAGVGGRVCCTALVERWLQLEKTDSLSFDFSYKQCTGGALASAASNSLAKH